MRMGRSRMVSLLAGCLALAFLAACAPTEAPPPMDTPLPTRMQAVEATPKPANTVGKPTDPPPEPTATPWPTDTPEPTVTPPPTSTPAPAGLEVSLVNLDVPPEDVVDQLYYSFMPTLTVSPKPDATPRPTFTPQPTSTPQTGRLVVSGNEIFLSSLEPEQTVRILVYTGDGDFVTEWYATVDVSGSLELQVSDGDPRGFSYFVFEDGTGRLLINTEEFEREPLKNW